MVVPRSSSVGAHQREQSGHDERERRKSAAKASGIGGGRDGSGGSTVAGRRQEGKAAAGFASCTSNCVNASGGRRLGGAAVTAAAPPTVPGASSAPRPPGTRESASTAAATRGRSATRRTDASADVVGIDPKTSVANDLDGLRRATSQTRKGTPRSSDGGAPFGKEECGDVGSFPDLVPGDRLPHHSTVPTQSLCRISALGPLRRSLQPTSAARAIQQWWRAARLSRRVRIPEHLKSIGEDDLPSSSSLCEVDVSQASADLGREHAGLEGFRLQPSMMAAPEALQPSIVVSSGVASSANVRPSRPYCPGNYEDPGGLAMASSDAEKAAQLRSKIKALQERHGRQQGTSRVSKEQTSTSENLPPCNVMDSGGLQESSRCAVPPILGNKAVDWPPPKSSLQRPESASTVCTQEPQDKLSSILSFLDEVEESSRVDMSSILSSARSSRAPWDHSHSQGDNRDNKNPFAAGLVVAPPGLSQDVAALQSKVCLLEVEVRDKKSIIETLKRALAETKTNEKQIVIDNSKDWEDKLLKQKAHYEAGLERHLKLVDRLLNDKTELTKRCELFSEELKAVERKFQMKMEELDEQASKNLARQKQNWVTAEKLRRDAWEKEKVKEIKEMTIKGLQPEVERILADRKQEKQKLEERQREALENQRRDLLEQAQVQMREAREHLIREQELALDQERQAHRRKLREEFERFNAQMSEERAKCAADLLAERRKAEQTRHQEVDSFESRLRDAVGAERAASEAKLQEAKQAASSTEERYRNELEALREQRRLELDQQRQELEARARDELQRQEAALREDLTRGRDKQLDVLMERLSREQVEQQYALKQEAATQLERVRAEAKEEARRLNSELEAARTQVSVLDKQQAILKEQVQDLQAQVEKEAARANASEERGNQLEAERAAVHQQSDEASQHHKQELWRACDLHEREQRRLREEHQQLADRAAEELREARAEQHRLQQRESQIIAELEARVKRTLQAKDEQNSELRARCAALENRIREFEYLLARQREELLSGLTSNLRA